MNIYTFHDNIGRDAANLPLVYLWKERWERQGWTPVILDRNDAQKHPDWERMAAAFNALPTVNGRQYEFACYIRWLAMEMVGGGWMSDYDVIPYDLKPRPVTEKITLWNGGACPCMVSGPASEYGRMARIFASWKPTEQDMNFIPGPHCSDQNICDQLTGEFAVGKLVFQYKDEGWEKAPAVHYAGCVMADKKPKFNWIPRLR